MACVCTPPTMRWQIMRDEARDTMPRAARVHVHGHGRAMGEPIAGLSAIGVDASVNEDDLAARVANVFGL